MFINTRFLLNRLKIYIVSKEVAALELINPLSYHIVDFFFIVIYKSDSSFLRSAFKRPRTMLRIYLAADSWGFSLHRQLVEYLTEQHGPESKRPIDVVDVGVYTKYYDAAHAVGLEVERAAVLKTAPTSSVTVRGILCCGSGQGMSVVANKFLHVYACLCTTPEQAQGCRAVNNANVLTFGARVTDFETARGSVEVWLATEMGEGLGSQLQELVAKSMQEIPKLDYSANATRRRADAEPPILQQEEKGEEDEDE